MKIIGLMTVWGAGPFVEPALKQAKDTCDELRVVVGVHHPKMKRFCDNTLEICNKYGDVMNIPDGKGSYMKWRSETLNKMISSGVSKGDWLYLVDVDEFLFKSDFADLKSKLESYDSVRFQERYFVLNMKNYVTKTSSPRLWRYDGGRFKPTDRWTNEFKNTYIQPNMFHYSLLCNPYAKMDFWETERPSPQPRKTNWMKDVYLQYDLNEKKWLAGDYGGSFGSDNGNLFHYDGPHPEYVEEAELPVIKDFRELWSDYRQVGA